MTITVAFWARVDRTEACWLWTGARNNAGYGRVHSDYAHRVAYRELVGPIPAGLELDHLCRVRHCVRPSHLEPVTHAENQRRAAAVRDAEPHCRNGHAWADNRYVSGQPYRRCRTCQREAEQRRPARVRTGASS